MKKIDTNPDRTRSDSRHSRPKILGFPERGEEWRRTEPAVSAPCQQFQRPLASLGAGVFDVARAARSLLLLNPEIRRLWAPCRGICRRVNLRALTHPELHRSHAPPHASHPHDSQSFVCAGSRDATRSRRRAAWWPAATRESRHRWGRPSLRSGKSYLMSLALRTRSCSAYHPEILR